MLATSDVLSRVGSSRCPASIVGAADFEGTEGFRRYKLGRKDVRRCGVCSACLYVFFSLSTCLHSQRFYRITVLKQFLTRCNQSYCTTDFPLPFPLFSLTFSILHFFPNRTDCMPSLSLYRWASGRPPSSPSSNLPKPFNRTSQRLARETESTIPT